MYGVKDTEWHPSSRDEYVFLDHDGEPCFPEMPQLTDEMKAAAFGKLKKMLGIDKLQSGVEIHEKTSEECDPNDPLVKVSTIVAGRVENMAHLPNLPGDEVIECDGGCGHQINASASTMKLKRANGNKVVCMECAQAAVQRKIKKATTEPKGKEN